jgi:hypothetical protein
MNTNKEQAHSQKNKSAQPGGEAPKSFHLIFLSLVCVFSRLHKTSGWPNQLPNQQWNLKYWSLGYQPPLFSSGWFLVWAKPYGDQLWVLSPEKNTLPYRILSGSQIPSQVRSVSLRNCP